MYENLMRANLDTEKINAEKGCLKKTKVAQFLRKCGIGDFGITPIPQDASSRVYFRVNKGEKSYILLQFLNSDSDISEKQSNQLTQGRTTHQEDLHQKILEQKKARTEFKKFFCFSEILIKYGFRAPKVFDYAIEDGLALLEDVGEMSLNSYIKTQSSNSDIISLYKKIVDILYNIQQKVEIRKIPREFYQKYDNTLLLKELNISINWYLPYITPNVKSENFKEEFCGLWEEVLSLLSAADDVWVHRDFHVDNLTLTPGFKKISTNIGNIVNSVGILDFQDCVFGSPIYDLASLVDDARIQISTSLRNTLLEHYCQIASLNREEVVHNYNILSAQRNLRILGVFYKKKLSNNDCYVKFIPRVEGYLKENFKYTPLKKISQLICSS